MKYVEEKRATKKLYTVRTEKMPFSDAFAAGCVSYSAGGSIFHDGYATVKEWLAAVSNPEFNSGFGFKLEADDIMYTPEIYITGGSEKNNEEFSKYVIDVLTAYLEAPDVYYDIRDEGPTISTSMIYPGRHPTDCGTCDGSMCDLCKKQYTVEMGSTVLYNGNDKEKAELIYAENAYDYSDDISEIAKRNNITEIPSGTGLTDLTEFLYRNKILYHVSRE